MFRLVASRRTIARRAHILSALVVLGIALTGATAQPAYASGPSSKWVKQGTEKTLKLAFMEALKNILPGAKIAAKVNSWAIDPFLTAATTEGTTEEKIGAWVIAMGQAGVKTMWPPYGITIAGGKIIIGSSIYTVEQMVSAARDEQLQAIITGKGTGGMLDRVNNVMAETPFMDLPLVRNRGITVENLGRWVKSEAELQQLWSAYLAQLRDLYGTNNALVASAEVWPRLLRMWEAQRAEAGATELASKLDQAMQMAEEEVAKEGGGAPDNGNREPAPFSPPPQSGPAAQSGPLELVLTLEKVTVVTDIKARHQTPGPNDPSVVQRLQSGQEFGGSVAIRNGALPPGETIVVCHPNCSGSNILLQSNTGGSYFGVTQGKGFGAQTGISAAVCTHVPDACIAQADISIQWIP